MSVGKKNVFLRGEIIHNAQNGSIVLIFVLSRSHRNLLATEIPPLKTIARIQIPHFIYAYVTPPPPPPFKYPPNKGIISAEASS